MRISCRSCAVDEYRQRLRDEREEATNITTTVLLNRRMTLCTFLGIRTDPIRRLRIIRTLLQPPLDDRTTARTMISFSTSEAERIGAGADDGRNDDVE